MQRIQNLRNIIFLIMFFTFIASYQFVKNGRIFINDGFYFQGKYSLQLCFQF